MDEEEEKVDKEIIEKYSHLGKEVVEDESEDEDDNYFQMLESGGKN